MNMEIQPQEFSDLLSDTPFPPFLLKLIYNSIFLFQVVCVCTSDLSLFLSLPLSLSPPLSLSLSLGSRMAEWLARLLSDQKVRGSIPGSNPLCSCHCGC